ncbi:MAG TPA: acetylxylan esterase [Rhizomicrobium sp.]|jgi:cephalosporin-C deacetylase-like acetyl esterase|nr:acetylxylan esterase [Rhizomicrobium sp.]
MHKRLFLFVAALVGVGAAASAQTLPDPNLVLEPFHSSGIYKIGEPAGWHIHALLGAGYTKFRVELSENNLEVVKSGVIDLSSGEGTIDAMMNHPGMLYLRLSYLNAPPPSSPPTAQELDKMTAGAAVAPEQITPHVSKPADFDAFWADKLAALKRVPVNPRIAPAVSDREGIALSTVTLDSLSSQVHGYLAAPNDGGKHPALVIFQYAGVYALQKNTVTDRAAEGWLAFDVDAHDMAPDQATAPLDYATIGDQSRETSYFLNMYLRDTRALDYIQSRPDWDGKTIVLMGMSMGGQQSFATAALNPGRVTAIIVNVPAGANFSGDLYGSRRGYPNWPVDDPQIVETARYFDITNFASAIKAESLVAFGFIDTTSPPFGVLVAFNRIQGPKEAVPMPLSDHNHITPQQEGAYFIRSREALESLRQTGHFTPNPNGLAP